MLVSDGLLADGPGWVLQQLELSAAKAEAPDLLAKKLVEAARARAVQRAGPTTSPLRCSGSRTVEIAFWAAKRYNKKYPN